MMTDVEKKVLMKIGPVCCKLGACFGDKDLTAITKFTPIAKTTINTEIGFYLRDTPSHSTAASSERDVALAPASDEYRGAIGCEIKALFAR